MEYVSVMISQPRYLPACNYLARIAMSSVLVYLDCVQYTKRDFENRNRILTPDGPMWLSVPVVHVSRDQKISETRIDDSTDWRRSHLNTLLHAYKKAPLFSEVYPLLETIYIQKYEYLIDLNEKLTGLFLDRFGLPRPRVARASALLTEAGMAPSSGQRLLADLCLAAGGNEYISGPNGRGYIEDGFFESMGITLRYHDYKCVPYPQANFDGEFQPFMGAVDLAMNCAPAKAREIIESGN